MNLEQAINNFREQVKDSVLSEAKVRQSGVEPVLRALGWPVHDSRIVDPEYDVKPGRVDFALRHPEKSTLLVFIEMKKSDNKLGERRGKTAIGLCVALKRRSKALEKGTSLPLAILTNGKIWKFYSLLEDEYGWR